MDIDKIFIITFGLFMLMSLLNFFTNVLANLISIATPIENRKYRIKENKIEGTFNVQAKYFCVWLTIKSFSDTDRWWAEANAKNLLDELNKEL